MRNILVRAANPLSVIWRLSRLRDFSEFKQEIFFILMSLIDVKERLMLCKFRRPAEIELNFFRDENYSM
jgi:hypothetical protein